MVSVNDIEKELDFSKFGVSGLELRAFSTIHTAFGDEIVKLVYLEEPPTRRMVATSGGQVPIWLPWIYHIIDISGYQPNSGWGMTYGTYRIGARSKQLTAHGGDIKRFNFFNLDRLLGGVCYSPKAVPGGMKASLDARIIHYINQWWMGLTNWHWIPAHDSALALEIFRRLFDTGWNPRSGYGTIVGRPGWTKTANGDVYIPSMTNNADIKPFLDVWSELTMKEVLSLQDGERLTIASVPRSQSNLKLLPKSRSENTKVFKATKDDLAELYRAAVDL